MKSTLLTFSLIFVSHILFSQTATFDWAEKQGGGAKGGTMGEIIKLDSKGNIYTIGTFFGLQDFDPDTGTYNMLGDGYQNIFISKLTPQRKILWAKSYKSYKYNNKQPKLQITGAVIDSSDNIIICGYFQHIVDLDPDTSKAYYFMTKGARESFITKLDSQGNMAWLHRFECTNYINFSSLVIDDSNYLYLGGTYRDTADFDPDTTKKYTFYSNKNSDDIVMVKLDGAGTLVWAKSIGGTSSDFCMFQTADKKGNTYMLGSFSLTVDFDPGAGITTKVAKSNQGDKFLLRLDAKGNFEWVKVYQVANGGVIYFNSINIDLFDNLYITGSLFGSAFLNPGMANGFTTATYKTYDIFVSRLSATGTFWIRKWANVYTNFHTTVDKDGGNYHYGKFTGKLDIDPGIGKQIINSPNYDMTYICKLDSSGKFHWVKTMVNKSSDPTLAGIQIDKNYDIYSTGRLYDTLDVDPDTGTFYLYSTNQYKSLIHKMTQCLPTFSFYSVSVCDSFVYYGKSIYKTGIYSHMLTNVAGCDSVINLYLTINNNNYTFYDTSCGSYNFNGNVLIASGTYYDTLTNSKGCDSIVTLSLTLNNNSFSYSYTNCNNYIFNGDTLTSSGVYYDTLVNVKGCDSIITLNLTILKSTINTIYQTSCNSFFYRGANVVASGVHYDTLTNAVGCDSITILHLTIIKRIINPISIAACSSYNFKSTILTSSGIYYDTLKAFSGCDSVVILNLTINHSSFYTFNEFPCVKYIFNGKTLRSSGVYVDTLVNAVGCDSIVMLNLFLTPVNTAVTQIKETLVASATGVNYQWLDCSNNFAPILYDTNQIFIAKTNGDFAVAITQNSCTDTSACFTVANLGIPNNIYTFSIFPNPTNGELRIQTNKIFSNASIKLYNITGQLVLHKANINGDSFIFDISEKPSGIYYLEITQDAYLARIKVVKE